MNSEPRYLTASGAGLFGKGPFPQNAARGLLGAAAHKQDGIFQGPNLLPVSGPSSSGHYYQYTADPRMRDGFTKLFLQSDGSITYLQQTVAASRI
jgi:hypothetical protein